MMMFKKEHSLVVKIHLYKANLVAYVTIKVTNLAYNLSIIWLFPCNNNNRCKQSCIDIEALVSLGPYCIWDASLIIIIKQT